ncbi:MAG: hypothetical protein WCD43_13195, partial [Candidatus Acidiferrales bacterium]
MKYLIASVVFITILAVPAARAQQTNTNCTLNGNTANCTSNSTPTFQQSMDSFNKSMQATGNNIAAARQANMNAKVKIEYCHQNPGGSVTTDSGQIRGCLDEIAYVKAACDVRKWKGLCGKDWAWIKTFQPAANTSPAGQQEQAVTVQSTQGTKTAECDSYENLDRAEMLSYQELTARAQKLSTCYVPGATDSATVASNAVYSATAQT